ncbi:hypothetical protein LTR95_015681 [Oleoguttula sp. CCFEE 5521]
MSPRKAPETQPTRKSGRLEAAKAVQQAILDEQNKVTNPKRFRRPQQRKRCHLLNKLPGEIRNMISRAVVLQGKTIVTAKGPRQPALSRSSRQIRLETLPIYYNANQFTVHVEDYDGAAHTPFKQQYSRYAKSTATCSIRMLGAPDWGNLMRWLKGSSAELGRALSQDGGQAGVRLWSQS